MPLFAVEAISQHEAHFNELARHLIKQVSEKGKADAVADFALPYVMGCLGIIYNRPQDVAEWISWGPDVWTAEVHLAGGTVTPETKRAQRERNFSIKTQRSAKTLDDYLTRVTAEAQNPGGPREPNDVWEFLVDVEPGGTKMNHDELLGTGSVLLAGGRDTVIKLISGFVWHLIKSPEDREFLRANPGARDAAITEMARYLSPLPKMERIEVGSYQRDGQELRVLLSFVSANFDDTQWKDPEKLDIHRDEKPNLAFGFGRHSCLGLQITRHESRAFLDAILSDWPSWTFDGEPELEWAQEHVGDKTVTILDHITAVPIITK
jgi:cytochrome P450